MCIDVIENFECKNSCLYCIQMGKNGNDFNKINLILKSKMKRLIEKKTKG